jgi:hypothetical protein
LRNVHLATTRYNLLKDGVPTGSLALKLTYVTNFLPDSSNQRAMITAGAAASEALANLNRFNSAGSGRMDKLSGVVDGSASAETSAQGMIEGVAPLATFVSPLKDALDSLGRLVKIVDGVAEVNIQLRICVQFHTVRT